MPRSRVGLPSLIGTRRREGGIGTPVIILQSKHKKDTFVTHLILLDEPEFETKTVPSVTPLVISTSDPFVALSQAMKDGSSLVVTPSSIPSSATCKPDADLSSKGFEYILEDLDDELVLKKRISNFDKKENAAPEAEFMETFERPRVAADIGIPSAAPSVTPIALVSTIPTVPVSAVPSVFASAVPTTPILMGPGPFTIALSQFEVGSSFATISNPVSKVAAFFSHFDQPEVNELNLADFWGSRPPYVDFHGFRVSEDCASHLVAVYSSHGDFIVGFAVEFVLDHLLEVTRALFMKKVQPVIDALDSRLEAMRKEVADLEGHHECLLVNIGPTLGLDSVCIFTHAWPIESCPLKYAVKAGSISLVMYFFQLSLGLLLPHASGQDPTRHLAGNSSLNDSTTALSSSWYKTTSTPSDWVVEDPLNIITHCSLTSSAMATSLGTSSSNGNSSSPRNCANRSVIAWLFTALGVPILKSYCDNCNNYWDILLERIGCYNKALMA
nr:hypothetical protein CFP56_24959 [Quercus suber]